MLNSVRHFFRHCNEVAFIKLSWMIWGPFFKTLGRPWASGLLPRNREFAVRFRSVLHAILRSNVTFLVCYTFDQKLTYSQLHGWILLIVSSLLFHLVISAWNFVNCLLKKCWNKYKRRLKRWEGPNSKWLRRLATVFLALECIFWSQNFAQKVNFDFLDTTPPFQHMITVYFLAGFLATAVTMETVMDNPSF